MSKRNRKPVHGRILQLTEEDGQPLLHLLVADRVLALPGPWRCERALLPGDIVSVEMDEQGRAETVVWLAGPQPAALDPNGDALRWRTPGRAPSRIKLLWRRQQIIRAIRDYLYEEGFLEVQTPLLLRGTCPDLHLDSIRVEGEQGYLCTSTEYQLKRMIVGGFERIFTLTQNFRAADRGDRHNPEFTMLEWARAGAELAQIEEDAERFIQRAFQRLYPHKETLVCDGGELRILGPWRRLSVREAFGQLLGLDVAKDFSLESMRAEVRRVALPVPGSFQQDAPLLFSYLIDRLQPRLGREVPVFLRDWPALLTPSALRKAEGPWLAERSELFAGGLELADGFPSLRDAALQERLFRQQLELRQQEGKDSVRLDERYLEALRQGIPPGAGMALGIDRLVMLLTGERRITDVMAFGWEEV